MFLTKVLTIALTAALSAPAPDAATVRRVTDHPVRIVRFLESGRLAWLGTGDRAASGPITVWDLQRGRAIRVLDGQPNHYRRGLVVRNGSTGEKTLTLADVMPGGRATVRSLDPRSGQTVAQIDVSAAEPGGNMVQAVEAIPRAGVLAVGSVDGFIMFWRRDGRDQRPDWSPAGSFPICELAASPDGRLLAVGIDRPTVGVWNWRTRKQVYAVSGRAEWGGLISLAFSPDGRYFAAGSFRGPVRLWDAATGRERATLDGHLSPAREVAFSPDSRLLGVIHDNGTLIVWELLTGRLRVRARLDPVQGRSVAFAPAGGMVAVAGSRGVCVYDPWAAPAGSRSSVAVAWGELGSEEPAIGFRAMRRLAGLPMGNWNAVRTLLPSLPDAAKRQSVDRLVGQLDAEKFTVRERAEVELRAIRFWADQRLRAAAHAAPSAEAGARLDRILADAGKPVDDKNLIRLARLAEVLERVTGNEADRLRRAIIERYPDCRLAQPVSAPE
jgi:hypothetical protein